MRRNWPEIIDKLNKSQHGWMRLRCGSPGSAQVTRCRLLNEWDGLEARTEGAVLILSLA